MILGSSAATSPAIPQDSQAAASKARLDEEMNRFLILLVTQLKNQDPLDPMDATEFTSQLVQFANVEQQILANANLEKLLSLEQSSQIANMVSFIGNTIEAIGETVPLEDGQGRFTYSLGVNAADVTIVLRNSAGVTVFSTEGRTDSGRHVFEWDGRTNNGQTAPDGAYTVIVSAVDREQNILDVEKTIFGRVTGAGAQEGVVTLFMGDVEVTIDKVLSVVESDRQTQTLQ